MNIGLPKQLAAFAARQGTRFIHLSSEQVFDGTRSPYSESDPVAPINRYGRQKVQSEHDVHSAAPAQAVTLRLPLLMGNSPNEKRSVHERLFADWSVGKTPKLYTDEFRQPCTAENLAALMLELSARPDIVGIFHWAGAELLSRYEKGVRIRAHFGLNETNGPLSTTNRQEDAAASSKRQANLGLNVQRLARLVKTPVASFAEQLAQLQVPSYAREWWEKNR